MSLHKSVYAASAADKYEVGANHLMVACRNENEADVKSMTKKKKSSTLQEKDNNGRTALHYCVENKTITCAEHVLTAEPSLLNVQDSDGYSILHLAVMGGNESLVKFLLEHGANMNSIDNQKHSAIHWSVVCGHPEILALLLSNKANPSTADTNGAYPLHYAAQMSGKNSKLGLQLLSTLLSRGTPVDCFDQEKRNPLLWAASAGGTEACIALVKAGVKVDHGDKDGLTALHCAASRGQPAVIECLINECSATVDIQDNNGCTPLFYAITLENLQCAEILLQLGASASVTDKRGRSPSHCAARKGDNKSLDMLKKANGDMWMRNADGDYPLHEAVMGGHKETVSFFLDLKPDAINLCNRRGRTSLHIAAMNGNTAMCKLLREHNARLGVVLKEKGRYSYLSPYDLAVKKKHSECAKILRYMGCRNGKNIVKSNVKLIQNQLRKILSLKPRKASAAGKLEILSPEARLLANKKMKRGDSKSTLSNRKWDAGKGKKMIKTIVKAIGVKPVSAKVGRNVHIVLDEDQENSNENQQVHTEDQPKSSNANEEMPKQRPKSSYTPRKTVSFKMERPKTSADSYGKEKAENTNGTSQELNTDTVQATQKPDKDLVDEIQKSVKIYECRRQTMLNLKKFKRLQMRRDSGYFQATVRQLMDEKGRPSSADIYLTKMADWNNYMNEQLKWLSRLTEDKPHLRNIRPTAKEQQQKLLEDISKAKAQSDVNCEKQQKEAEKEEKDDQVAKDESDAELKQAVENVAKLYGAFDDKALSVLSSARESNIQLDGSIHRTTLQRRRCRCLSKDRLNIESLKEETEKTKEQQTVSDEKTNKRSPRSIEAAKVAAEKQRKFREMLQSYGERYPLQSLNLQRAYTPMTIPDENRRRAKSAQPRSRSVPEPIPLNFDHMASRPDDPVNQLLPRTGSYPERPATARSQRIKKDVEVHTEDANGEEKCETENDKGQEEVITEVSSEKGQINDEN